MALKSTIDRKASHAARNPGKIIIAALLVIAFAALLGRMG